MKTSLKSILQENTVMLNKFKHHNLLMQMLDSATIAQKSTREKLLDCLQIFSDHFQRVVLLRSALTEESQFATVASQHLAEEVGHNLTLLKERNNRAPVWDAILESTTSWFAWKMMTLDNCGRTLLVHLVLETSANAFFNAAHHATKQFEESAYFKIHSEADEFHQDMGIDLLDNLNESQYLKLRDLQQKGWDILNTACNRIASIATAETHTNSISVPHHSQYHSVQVNLDNLSKIRGTRTL